MLASNWRLFIVCPHAGCIVYALVDRCASTLQPGTSTKIGTQILISVKYTSVCTLLDATNRIAVRTTGQNAARWIGCLQPVIFEHHAPRSYTSAEIAGIAINLGLPGVNSRRPSPAITSDTYLRYHPRARAMHSFW